MTKLATTEDPELLGQIEPTSARALVAAGIECFAEQGFHATTTRDISTRAGLSPAAVYVHFPSKGDLLYTISRSGHERALAALEAAAGEEPDPARRIELIVAAFSAWHARNHRLARVVQYEREALPEARRAEIYAIRQRFDEYIEGELAAGVATGRLVAPDVSGAALAILSLCIDVARWYSPSEQRSPEQVGDLYGGLILRMLGAAPA
jgi:AcrR family transcriptional regulator